MQQMMDDVSILKQVAGIQYYGAGDDRYWAGYMTKDKFEDWLEGYEHECRISFRSTGSAKVRDRVVRELAVKEWAPGMILLHLY